MHTLRDSSSQPVLPWHLADSAPWIISWVFLALPGYLLYTMHVGLSLPIDYFIYHDYAALQASQNRLEQDLFPAGLQSYLNPYGYLLLEWMLQAELASWWIALIFAALHSLNALFIFLICSSLALGRSIAARRVLWVGGLTGAISPMILSVIGTSFLDPVTSAPMLAALWLVLEPNRRSRTVLLACFLAGVSTGLKLTNAPFALAIAATVVFIGRKSPSSMLMSAGCGALAMWAGVAVTHGWWSWQLWKRFDNPFFPFFNQLFKSTWAPADTLAWPRFVPEGLVEVLTLPFRMALPKAWVYTESIAPDLTLAGCVVLLLVAGAMALWRHLVLGRKISSPISVSSEWHFWIYFLVGGSIWLFTSGNGRYALPLLPLTGVAFALLALRTMNSERALMACSLVLLLQIGNLWLAGAVRWSTGQWSRQWIAMDVPASLRSEPILLLSADGFVKSAVARHLHSESSVVQLVGATYSTPTTGRTGEWLQEAINVHKGRTWAIFASPMGDVDNPIAFGRFVEMLSRTIDRAGLSIDRSRCEKIGVNGQPPAGPNFNQDLPPPARETLFVCPAEQITPSTELAIARDEVDLMFAALEERCPDLYRPAGIQTEGDGKIWTRVYPMHDALIVTINRIDGSISHRLFGQSNNDRIAGVERWNEDIRRYDCRVPFGGLRGSDSLPKANLIRKQKQE